MSERVIYEFTWTMHVPIFRNPVIMKQLGMAIGIPFGLLCLFLMAVGGKVYAMYALGLIGVLFLLTFLFILAVYGGKYDVGYVLDSKGVMTYTLPKQARKNRVVNGLAVLLGLLSGKPAAAGAGLLAASRQSTFIRWVNIRKVIYEPRNRVIFLRGGLTERVALFCSEENYCQVEAIVHGKTRT